MTASATFALSRCLNARKARKKMRNDMYLRRLTKSPDRLAMEIKGKDPDEGYRHLLRYGLEEAEAREVVTLFWGRKTIDGDVSRIAEAIEDALRAIRYDRERVREILSGAWQYWQSPEKKTEKTEDMKMKKEKCNVHIDIR
jgi:hypothetical protein